MPSLQLPRLFRSALFALPAALVLAACSAPPMDEQDAATAQAQQAAQQAAAPTDATGKATEAPPVGSCDATQVQSLIGQPSSDAVARQAQQDAGAREVRTLGPQDMTTMEFVGERLNIEVDAKGVITGVRCG
ncbi:I78 family peptidase inhibitor [Xanthomonas sp. 60]